MPRARSLAQIKANLLQPALTSHFEVSISPPKGLTPEYFRANGLNFGYNSVSLDKLNLLCSETVLPGSSIATFELNNDYHGATVRHAHRRLYDDRIDLTFYVSIDDYLPIRFFETWIKYIAGESIVGSSERNRTGRPGSGASNYFYRMNYPENYISKGSESDGGLSITKFERTGSGNSYTSRPLKYKFIDVFPISINSMPVSYDASSLLKCTVSLTYVRYVLLPPPDRNDPHEDENNSQFSSSTNSALTPAQQAALNSASSGLTGVGALSTPTAGLNVGGVPNSSANSSGNTVSGFTVGANSNIA